MAGASMPAPAGAGIGGLPPQVSSPFGDVDLSKHEDEAQQIWAMLDEMSEKDPEVSHGLGVPTCALFHSLLNQALFCRIAA
jgi:hypothetical protein